MKSGIGLLVAPLAAAALIACGGQAVQPKAEKPASPRAIAQAFYCADLTSLQADLKLALSKGDLAKYGAAEFDASQRLSADADRFQAAGESTAAGRVRQLSIMLSLDGQAHQSADLDPFAADKVTTDTMAAIKDAPGC